MSAQSLPFAIAMMVIVGFLAVGLVLIPALDEWPRRAEARKAAALARLAEEIERA